MKNRNHRGVAHILLLAILVLIGLSLLARCDIDSATADEIRPYRESSDERVIDICRHGNHPARRCALLRSV